MGNEIKIFDEQRLKAFTEQYRYLPNLKISIPDPDL
jgi:hypothetical protein